MKKHLLMALAVAALTACEKLDVPESEISGDESSSVVEGKTKKFTFTVKGDFGTAFTRGYLQADGKDMTDLWLLDYVDGVLVQQLHQSNEDDDFGTPTMNLSYGTHHVYFVASRGTTPTLNTESHMISWSTVRDTFWKDYEVSVVATSNGNRAVTLDRVVTKLRVTANDAVPMGVTTFSVTPAVWYYGLDYVSGEPVMPVENQSVVVNVPSSYAGTSGEMMVSVFGFSGSTEWTTDVVLDAKNGGSETVGHAVIEEVPLKRNRMSDYTGPMFGSGGLASVSLNTEWADAVPGTW